MNKYVPFVLRPCAMDMANNKKIWQRHPAFVEKDFEAAYMQHLADAKVVVESAKIYAEANWKRVRDWSDLDVEVKDKTGKTTTYYKYVERKPFIPKKTKKHITGKTPIKEDTLKEDWSALDRIMDKLERKRKNGHNPVKKVANVVLDPSDGDFSIDINGKPHWWINGEAVITIAAYIEKAIAAKAKTVKK